MLCAGLVGCGGSGQSSTPSTAQSEEEVFGTVPREAVNVTIAKFNT